MKTRKIRAAALLLALCLLLTPATAAVIDPGTVAQPMYTGMSSFGVNANMSSSGYALGRVQANLYSGYSAKVMLSLQRSDGVSNYESIYSWWSDIGTNVVSLEKGRYVLSGYYYRFRGTAYIYDAKGNLVDAQTKYTGVMQY